MNTNNYNETMNNCRNYLRANSNIKAAYENLPGSSSSGFEYTLQNSMAVKVRVDSDIDFLILEVYAGITARGEHLAAVSEYCQQVSRNDIVYLAVDADQGNIYVHSETSYHDNPVSEELIHEMENHCVNLLQRHFPMLESLAYGKLPDWNFCQHLLKEKYSTDNDADDETIEDNIDAMLCFLAQGDHNVAAESLDFNTSSPFFLETMSKDERSRIFTEVHGNWLILKARPDIQCNKVFSTQLAQMSNNHSSDKKIGFLYIGEDGYPYCRVATHLHENNPISRETFEAMASIARCFLSTCESELRYLGHGVLPPEYCKGVRVQPSRFGGNGIVPKMPLSLMDIIASGVAPGMSMHDDDMDWAEED